MKTISNATYTQIQQTLKAVSSMVVDARRTKDANMVRRAKLLLKKLNK